ncbi:MAG: DUF2225 domain-containing protein [Spirochaetes bacterium]|nr:DUF2225 domain-containing protein [Spirochaetota bacterium]
MGDDLLDFLDDLDKKPLAAKPAAMESKPAPDPAAKENQAKQPPKEKEDPILLIRVQCPLCQGTLIEHQELKAKSVTISLDRFCVPLFGESAKYKTVDYNLKSVTVCPQCLFASPDRRDFIGKNPVTGKPDKSQLSENILKELGESKGARQEIYRKFSGGPNLFEHERTRKMAVLSYHLSIHRATAEIKFKNPRAYFKRGFTWAKIALLERQEGRDGKAALENARKDYEVAFTAWDFPNDEYGFQTVYSMGAIWYYSGNKDEATKYVSLLDKYRMDLEQKAKKDSAIQTGPIRKWVGIARDMWERKDEPGWWDVK